MKPMPRVFARPPVHWVGDGFEARTLFSYEALGPELSPFLLLDYAGPTDFPPSETRRGVGAHPHRGFETVTIVFQGDVEHRDSAGNAGRIGPGDVQWMTAGAGVIHEEMHSAEFTRQGGTLELMQLWVNLPRQSKHTPPGYQTLTADAIPVVRGANGSEVRVIAGELQGIRGPAHTFTPMNVWDLRLPGAVSHVIRVPNGHHALVAVRRGNVDAGGDRPVAPAEFALFPPGTQEITLAAREPAAALFLTGAPIAEPIAGYGPFVMNTADEIEEAVRDFRSGRMGRL